MRKLLLFATFFLLTTGGAHAATYYVGGSGCNDANNGTSITTPWCTISKANTKMVAGDKTYIRGGQYKTYINPANSGNSSNYITYQAYQGEVPVITGTPYAVYMSGKSYIKVIGIKAQYCSRMMYITGKSHHVTVQGSTFAPSGTYSDWATNRINGGSSYITLTGNTFGQYGTTNDSGVVLEVGNEKGDGTHHILIDGNMFYRGGHHTVGFQAHTSIFRNNYVHNENWINGKYGGRGLYSQGYITNTYGNLIEGNTFAYSGQPGDSSTDAAGLNVNTSRNIVRRNVAHSNSGPGISLYCGAAYYQCPANNYVYNNTTWNNGTDVWGTVQSSRWVGFFIQDAGGPGDVKGNIFKNNIAYGNKTGAFYGAAGAYTASNTLTTEPYFVNARTGDPMQKTLTDLQLKSASSAAVDAGGWLTTATSSGSNSTTLVVADGGYFTDGLGLIKGDVIQFKGQTQKATIVRKSGNTLTLDTPLTWSAGTGVALVYTGAGPDIGAFEFGVNQPARPVGLQVT